MKNCIQNLLRRLQVILFLVIVTGMAACTVQEYTEKADKGAEAYELMDSITHQMERINSRFDSIEHRLDTLTPADKQRMHDLTRLTKAVKLNSFAR